MKQKCRIVVVGDEGVGKTSLISTFISEAFPEKVKGVMAPVTVSPELTPDHVPLTLVDTPSKPDQKHKVLEEIQKADVVVVVYSVDQTESLSNVANYWLREVLRPQKLGIPVVLVGNKIDLRPQAEGTNSDLENEIMPIMNEFREVETCIEVSAKAMLNVTEMFYFSVKAVVHPTPPLYDMTTHALKPLCAKALTRVFRLLDTDKNGFLNDSELQHFQQRCFKVDLSEGELRGVKQVVRENCAEGVNPLKGITLPGFLFLHTLFIERGRLETTWVVLRTFGYDDKLQLSGASENLKRMPDQAVELSEAGRAFITAVYNEHAKDPASGLTKDEAELLFSTTPTKADIAAADAGPDGAEPALPAWAALSAATMGEHVATAAGKGVDLEGLVNLVRAHLVVEPEKALEQLCYFGYDDVAANLVTVTKRRRTERKKKRLDRDTLLCYVFGSKGSGKTSLLRAMVGKKFSDVTVSKDKSGAPYYTVRTITPKGEGTKTLVLREVEVGDEVKVLQSKTTMEACDLVCLLIDRTNDGSFLHAKNILEKITDHGLPVMFVSSKADKQMVQQLGEHQPEQFCNEHGIPVPLVISTKNNEKYGINDGAVEDLEVVFDMMATVALNPALAGRELGVAAGSSTGAMVGKALAAVVLSGAVAYGVKLAWGAWKGGNSPNDTSNSNSNGKK